MRDDVWLRERLEAIWSLLFPEVERKNNVVIRFKGRWKNKFGHIRLLRNKDSEIAINAFFREEVVPEYIIDVTIAHELVHYMHGFNSPHPKLFSHPHKGGVVDRELRRRGFGNNLMMERRWVKDVWPEVVKQQYRRKVPHRSFGLRWW